MHKKIAFRLVAYFAAVLLVFSAIIGGVYLSLFVDRTVAIHRQELEQRAQNIAQTLGSYLISEGGDGSSKGRSGGMGGSGGYGMYIRFINDIALTDVWIVDENRDLITKGQGTGSSLTYADLPQDADGVINQVFLGSTAFSESFSAILNTPTLTVGAPIAMDGKVVGVVLLHSPVDGTDEAIGQGLLVLTISMGVALAAAIAVSVALSLTFTRPLQKMKDTAASLTRGNFGSKTGVSGGDEIGQLARSIDMLAMRLDEASKESERLEQMRKDFIANVSHELRTPVTVIRGSLEALCDGVVTKPEQVKNYHEQMLRESKGLQRLVTDLLELSRLQNPNFSIEKRPVNLSDILSDAVRSMSHIAKQKNIAMLEMGHEKPIPVTGDYDRLKQMFLIVLDNAVKFSSPGSDVRVSCTFADPVTVQIADRGTGIDKAELPHLFQRFYKTKSEENREGSGLGLAVAKQIADRHGIKIQVISEKGEGSVFLFSFPKQ